LTESNRPTASDLAGEVFSFAAAIRDCKSLDACAALFRQTIARYGFDSFASGEVDSVERSRSMFYIVDWPKRMLDFYVASGYVSRDPLLDEIKRLGAPFTWSALLRDKFLSRAGREMLGRMADEGWTEGLAVPFPRSETRFGLVSLVGARGPVNQHEKDGLSIMALCLHEQARRLGPVLGVALALSELSLRELDSLRLVACGHSDKQIGVLLGIAQSTAQEHVEAAKRKLKVRNRAEAAAAAVAVSLGLS
jgi:DNA-binding CsgD family transcriptional regulator